MASRAPRLRKGPVASGLKNAVSARAGWLVLGSVCCIVAMVALAPAPDIVGMISAISARALPLLVVSLGLSVVISAAEIDLSAPGIISFGAMLLVWLASLGLGWILAWTAVLALGGGLGLVQGWLVARRGAPALVLTLGSSYILLGGATVLALGLQRSAAHPGPGVGARTVPANYTLGNYLPSEAVAAALLLGVLGWRFTTLGAIRHLATGLDRNAARSAALPVERICVRAFVFSGFSAALGSLMLVDFIGGGAGPRIGFGYELLGIAACVIGGVKISGGHLRPLEVSLASFLIRSIDEAARTLPFVPTEMYLFGIGILVVFVASIDTGKLQGLGKV